MKKLILIILLLKVFSSIAQTNYFVTLSGNDNNSGTSETDSWKTITYALSGASPVEAGDTVFVKAGYYTDENIVIDKNGTKTKPIVIQGYKSIPGDNPDYNFDYGDKLDSILMPLLDGLNRTTGIGIDINGSKNITINNLQITNYEYGIMDHTETYDLNTTLNNIYITNIGNTLDSYSGKAIEFYSSNNEINNCVVVNASAQGILVEGDYNKIVNCKIYCDDSTSVQAAMDYYIVIYFGSNNTVENCYVERIGDLPHYGHGIGAKGDCENNLIKNCIAVNFRDEAFYVRHRGSRNNTFQNCKAIGVTIDAAGFIVRDGASNNLFNNCRVDSCKRGFMLYDSTEDDDAQYCGRNNVFNNCIVTNTEIGIDFNDYELDSDVDSNIFYNCIFYSGTTLINVERNNFENKMINCIVSGYQNLKMESNGYSLSFDFNYCDFYDNGFETPSGIGNISDNPMFEDAINSDFHLTSTSPCIDAGTDTGAPVIDYDGNLRPQGNGFDIGAFEYLTPSFIADPDKRENIIAPNPTKGRIYIQNNFQNKGYQLYSSTGLLVKKGKIETDELDLSYLNSGIYFLIIGNKTNMKKIIKF